MFINWALKEIHLKIVYYGPALGGKTQNLKYIYEHIDPALKSDLVMLKTHEERTIFFDFLQLEVGHIEGKRPKFNLYTVPGQIRYQLTRKVVLNGVDGIVFVADSQRDRMEENLETLLDLEKQLIVHGKSLENFPWVLQYNKRDLPEIASVEEMQQKLNFFGVPAFEASALTGVGVFPTLKTVIKQVVTHVKAQLSQDVQRMRA